MQDATAYLGLGSNLGDREANLRLGIEGLQDRGLRLRALSSFYLTEPDLGAQGSDETHPWYINCVAAFDTALSPGDLLATCLEVEASHGRERGTESPEGPQPRTLDIDILLYGALTLSEPGLQVPHPRMGQRRFVLQPLAEIAPALVPPGSETSVAEQLAALPQTERVSVLQAEPHEVA